LAKKRKGEERGLIGKKEAEEGSGTEKKETLQLLGIHHLKKLLRGNSRKKNAKRKGDKLDQR